MTTEDVSVLPRVVVFDVLGTVLDERGSFRAAAERACGPDGDSTSFADRWLDAVSSTVAGIARGEEPWRPWDEVVGEHLRQLAPGLDPAASVDLAGVGHRLRAWPDSAAGLAAVRSRAHVVAMSNAGLIPLMDSFRLNDLSFSTIVSSEMVRSAKPDPRVYGFLLDVLRVDSGDVLFAAAHPWDLRAAADHGMRTALIDRADETDPHPDDRFDRVVGSLIELVGTLDL